MPNKKPQPFSGKIKDIDLDMWIKNKFNVLFIGKHGIGKTERIKAAMERNNIPFLYFSAATMDPWTDFVGVPKEVNDGEQAFLEFILPKQLIVEKPKILVFDELNRAAPKVRNAVMELIQFKSINGRKFDHLESIWAAINPEDDDDLDFDVEPLDPAQRDRFQIQIELPYKPDAAFFSEKFGKKVGSAVCDWWSGLSRDLQLAITPRRLEYAINVHQVGANIRHVLPRQANVSALCELLQSGPPEEAIKEMMENVESAKNDEEKESALNKARVWLAQDNNLKAINMLIEEDADIRSFCVPLLEEEIISDLIVRSKAVQKEIKQNPFQYKDVIEVIAHGSQNQRIKRDFTKLLDVIKNSDSAEGFDPDNGVIIGKGKSLPDHFTESHKQHIIQNFEFVTDFEATESVYNGPEKNIDAMISRVASQALAASNSFLIKRAVENLKHLAVSDMSVSQSENTLRIINYISGILEDKQMKSYEQISSVFNCAVKCILNEKEDLSVEDVYNLCPYFCYVHFSGICSYAPNSDIELILIEKDEADQVEIVDPELDGVEI